MAEKISSLDIGYTTGDLSVFPEAIDSRASLYDAKNNADTVLSHGLSFNSKFVLVADTSGFPDKGLLRVGEELIYYDEKGTGVFKDLIRGFAGSVQNVWSRGTKISNSVMAEHHNALKDATINIEAFFGIKDNPLATSFNGQLIALENKALAPKPSFRAFPRSGEPALAVRFQNFSNQKETVRFLWDFGDGITSTETSPTHTYLAEGDYTIQLRMVTSIGGQGVMTKKNYVKVRDDGGLGFMYVVPEMGTTSTVFEFVDQTDGDIATRHWSFDDGIRTTVEDPDIHTITHQYAATGTYDPTLLVIFSDQRLKRVNLNDSIVVS